MEAQLPSAAGIEAIALSKNQLKKLKRDQEWEANRAKRKAKRKEKLQEKKQRKRAAREGLAPPTAAVANAEPVNGHGQGQQLSNDRKPKRAEFIQLPITVVLDCGFDDLMNDKERKSLGAQVTRSYSDSHKAPFQTYLVVSSFGGPLKERFEGLLEGHYHSWKGVRFLEGDFVQAAEQAKDWMRGDRGGRLAGAFENPEILEQSLDALVQNGEVVYLTSDSPNTLTKLRPYSTYIIGGLVDRNRHKGICYKRAMERGMKTAKLPIGDYMQMTSRFVLATNHVAAIMLRWLDLGDWGKAFLQVMPKRKGGVLKETHGEANGKTNEETQEGDHDNERKSDRTPRTPIDERGDAEEEAEDVESLDEDLENGSVTLQ